MLMRKKGMLGAFFGKYANLTNSFSKSSGNAIELGIAVNPPVWSALPDVNVVQGGSWTQDLNTFTTGLDPQTFSVATGTLPTGINLNSNGTFSGTVTNLGGAGSVTYNATNTSSVVESGTQDWTIP